MQAEELKRQCRGKWYGILTQIGIDPLHLTKKHVPCPICGGTDRFRWIDLDGTGNWYCNQGAKKAGDGLGLAQKHLGRNFPETLEIIQKIVGGCEVAEIKPEQNINQKKANLNQLWQASTELTGSDPASKYLHNRGLTLTPAYVRFCPACYEPDTRKEYPALIAKILNAEGKPVGLQRIYLTDADVGSKKKLMPGTENLNGAAIRLFSPADRLFDSEIIGIAEGICTGMAAAQLHGVAVWASISNILMESWKPPEDIRHVVVFGDNDSSHAGAKSAYILANKLYLKDLIVDVVLPKEVGDFNDVLRSTK